MKTIESAFDCFSSKKEKEKSKVDKMAEMLPFIQRALENGYLLKEVLPKTVEFIGSTESSYSAIRALYLRALKKQTQNKPAPAKSSAPAPKPVSKPAPAPDPVPDPVPKSAEKPVEKPAEANAPDSDSNRFRDTFVLLEKSDEARAVLHQLGTEAGNWCVEKDYTYEPDTVCMIHWMKETGKKAEVERLVRAVLKGRGSQKHDEALSDQFFCKFLARGFSDVCLQIRLDRAKAKAEANKHPAERIFSAR